MTAASTDVRYMLVIGNKAWSSWSLRPWIAMREFAIPFAEQPVALRQPDTAAAIQRWSPSGKIPALVISRAGSSGGNPGHTGKPGDLIIWDSLAILEFLADRHADLPLWPRDPLARAIARSVSAEMHSGFAPLRQNCPMDFHGRGLQPADPAAIRADVSRIVALWADCRRRYGVSGPFLFGTFTIADAMYAPVVSRFLSYDVGLDREPDAEIARAYMAAIAGLAGWASWGEGAAEEQVATD
jgi:glutathione S-transferase